MRKNRLSNKSHKDWLDSLLRNNFGNCEKHQENKFNEKNVFCIDCAVSLCRYCKEPHTLHARFQIYKYCYQEVVRQSEMQKYFDCSNIQTYVSNNDKIVHLKPRPSFKDIKLTKRPKLAEETKTSTPSKLGGTCEECGKHLLDGRNRFCSISCKISVLQLESQKQGLPIQANDNQNSEAESSISTADPYECVEKGSFRKRPRKSTPFRAPMF